VKTITTFIEPENRFFLSLHFTLQSLPEKKVRMAYTAVATLQKTLLKLLASLMLKKTSWKPSDPTGLV